MTSTPTAASSFTSKYGDFVRKAGSKFGFNNLAALFADDEDTSKALQGFMPAFKLQSISKGRPSSLTYTTPKTKTEIAEFSLTPEGTGSTVGTVTEPSTTPTPTPTPSPTPTPTPTPTLEPTVQEKADRLLSSFIGPVGLESPGYIGAAGIGRAQEYGYTPAQIKAKAQQEGLQFGPEAAQQLGLQAPAMSTSPTTSTPTTAASTPTTAAPIYSAPTATSPIAAFANPSAQGQSAIGLAGLERAAKAKGITIEQAANRAVNQGLTLGAEAAKLLRSR